MTARNLIATAVVVGLLLAAAVIQIRYGMFGGPIL